MIMNDKDFREKCLEISYANIDDYMQDVDERQCLVSTRKENVDILKTAALLFIAANMPSANDKDKKPCKLCGSSKTIDCTGVNLDGGVDHYFYINTKQKQLVEVNGKVETHISIKNCPMCGREL